VQLGAILALDSAGSGSSVLQSVACGACLWVDWADENRGNFTRRTKPAEPQRVM